MHTHTHTYTNTHMHTHGHTSKAPLFFLSLAARRPCRAVVLKSGAKKLCSLWTRGHKLPGGWRGNLQGPNPFSARPGHGHEEGAPPSGPSCKARVRAPRCSTSHTPARRALTPPRAWNYGLKVSLKFPSTRSLIACRSCLPGLVMADAHGLPSPPPPFSALH